MSLAAVKNDAMAIRKRLLAKKQPVALSACTAAPAAPAFAVGRLKPTADARDVVGPTWVR